MKTKYFVAVSVVAALIGSSVVAGGMKRIRKEADFRAKIVGKTLRTGNDGQFVLTEDGKSSGKVGSKKWVGVWAWQKGYYCTKGIFDGKERPLDCKLVKFDGTTMSLKDNKGRGKRLIEYTVE